MCYRKAFKQKGIFIYSSILFYLLKYSYIYMIVIELHIQTELLLNKLYVFTLKVKSKGKKLLCIWRSKVYMSKRLIPQVPTSFRNCRNFLLCICGQRFMSENLFVRKYTFMVFFLLVFGHVLKIEYLRCHFCVNFCTHYSYYFLPLISEFQLL